MRGGYTAAVATASAQRCIWFPVLTQCVTLSLNILTLSLFSIIKMLSVAIDRASYVNSEHLIQYLLEYVIDKKSLLFREHSSGA